MWIQRLFFALLIIAIVQGWFFARWNLKGLTYRRQFTPLIANEGDTVTMIEEIRNAKLLPIPWLRIEAEISPNLVFGRNKPLPKTERQFHRSIFSLPAYTTITRTHQVHCPHRGYYHIKTVSITTGDLLGIGNFKSVDIQTDTAITVYPTLYPIEQIFSLRNSFTGDVVVRRWIVDDPFMIRGVREYAPGDPQNRINWKATAKTGVLQVHDYDFTSDVRLMIYVNVDTHENQWSVSSDEACAERGISIVASIAQYAIENGIETGLGSNGAYIDDKENMVHLDPCANSEHLAAIFEALSKLTLMRRYTFPTMLEQEITNGITNRDILIVSAYIDDNTEIQIARLRAAGNSVEIIHVPYSDELREYASGQAAGASMNASFNKEAVS